MTTDIPSPNADRFAQAPRGDRTQPRRVRCLNPFRWMEVGDGGEVTPCCAPWFKGSLGNINEQSPEEIWNGPAYQELREAMYDGGKWGKFCNAATCPHIQNDTWVYPDFIDSKTYDTLPITDKMLDAIRDGHTALDFGPAQMGFSCDPRCNLKCIMCSTLTNPKRDGSSLRAALQALEQYLPDVRQVKMMGDGEVFAVPESRDFLFNFDQEANPHVGFFILTNAMLLTPDLWKKIEHLQIPWMGVSMDGATPETYEKIRAGGKWDKLVENIEFLLERHREGKIGEFHINMCVMRSNHHEMVKFAELGKKWGVTSAYFLPILGDYEAEQIFVPPDAECLARVVEQLKHPLLNDAMIGTSALTPWFDWKPETAESAGWKNRLKRLIGK